MKSPNIILVYDHDCPVCHSYCRVVSIRKAAGNMTILNARDNPPIMEDINRLGIDMDQGFVLKIGEEFYHGADAIHSLALLSTRTGVFNRLNYRIFKSKTLSKFLYPILKAGRRGLLILLGKPKLNNLKNLD
ncbi:MAG: hypothetical protein COA91_04520 [Robiginitomaculum sp.]|nr:MAG: hypothetical protein COA91_04520 [Robiginitomaculum sp.]